MNRKILAAAVTAATLGVTAVAVTSATAQPYRGDQLYRNIAIVANNNIDGPVAEAATQYYSRPHGDVRRFDFDTDVGLWAMRDADCAIFVGADARKMADSWVDVGAGRSTVVVQGGDRWETARRLMSDVTKDACLSGYRLARPSG